MKPEDHACDHAWIEVIWIHSPPNRRVFMCVFCNARLVRSCPRLDPQPQLAGGDESVVT